MTPQQPPRTARNTKDIRKANKRLLFRTLGRQTSATITELEHMTRLSRPTVTLLVRELETENLIGKTSARQSSGGRAPIAYAVNQNARFVIGIDFEFPTVRMIITNLAGEIICQSSERYPSSSGKDEILPRLFAELEALIQQSGIAHDAFLGIGFGLPGVVNFQSKQSITIDRISNWHNVPIGSLLEAGFGMPVYIRNDVDLLAWAQTRLYPHPDQSNTLFIAIRHGMGMAIMHNDETYCGDHGNSGLIGHMIVKANGRPCHCGNRGCLGMYASAKAMLAGYQKTTGELLPSMHELIARYRQNDPAAIAVLQEAGRYLGIGIINTTYIMDVSNVVVSADFDLQPMIRYAQEELKLRNSRPYYNQVSVISSTMQPEQYALGGCFMLLESIPIV